MGTFLERFLPGQSAGVKRLREEIARLNSPANLALIRTVLIVGESGAGKSYVAKVLAAHREAVQSQANVMEENLNLESFLLHFDEINIPNLPETLVESELFGHTKGSFTGATQDKIGLLSDEGGTIKTDILLDEIGDASATLQAKLLQVVESGRFRRLGAPPGDDEATHARLAFATNRVLEDDVRAGKFREDLYWRLKVVRIVVPPLREQPDQIETLLNSVLQRLLLDISQQGVALDEPEPSFSAADMAWARSYAWPGNVRELRGAVQRWLVNVGTVPLRDVVVDDASERLRGRSGSTPSGITARLAGDEIFGSLGDLLSDADRDVKKAILDWFARTRPTNAELERRFPKMQARSVRQKLSDWRRDLDEG